MIDKGCSGSCLVSVIIPVYNDQTGLDACLNALASQNWQRDCCEIIVVDNGSKPPVTVPSSLRNFVRLVRCTKPGAYTARNVGICEARGEILAFTDADCMPDPNWINAGVAEMKRNKDRCIIGGEVVMAVSPTPTAVELYQYLTGFMQRQNIENKGFSATANLFVTSAQMKRVGLFDERLFSGGDREWCWRAAGCGFSIKYVPEAKVATMPRTSLTKAVRQVRRVAGGRFKLQKMKVGYITSAKVRPHRTGWRAAKWILVHSDISFSKRVRVFGVALVLKIVQVLESIRLFYDRTAERR